MAPAFMDPLLLKPLLQPLPRSTASEPKVASAIETLGGATRLTSASLKEIGNKITRFPEDTTKAIQDVEGQFPNYEAALKNPDSNKQVLQNDIIKAIVTMEAVIATAKTASVNHPELSEAVQNTLIDARQTLSHLDGYLRQVKQSMPLIPNEPAQPSRRDWNLIQVKDLCKQRSIPELEQWVSTLKHQTEQYSPAKQKEFHQLSEQIKYKKTEIDSINQGIEHDSEFARKLYNKQLQGEAGIREREIGIFETKVHAARARLPELEQELTQLEAQFTLLKGSEEDLNTLNYVEPYLLHQKADSLISQVENRARYKQADKPALLQQARKLQDDHMQFYRSKMSPVSADIFTANLRDFEHLADQIIPRLESDAYSWFSSKPTPPLSDRIKYFILPAQLRNELEARPSLNTVFLAAEDMITKLSVFADRPEIEKLKNDHTKHLIPTEGVNRFFVHSAAAILKDKEAAGAILREAKKVETQLTAMGREFNAQIQLLHPLQMLIRTLEAKSGLRPSSSSSFLGNISGADNI